MSKLLSAGFHRLIKSKMYISLLCFSILFGAYAGNYTNTNSNSSSNTNLSNTSTGNSTNSIYTNTDSGSTNSTPSATVTNSIPESDLGLTNILNIFLIVIGVLLILLAVAILIRLKK